MYLYYHGDVLHIVCKEWCGRRQFRLAVVFVVKYMYVRMVLLRKYKLDNRLISPCQIFLPSFLSTQFLIGKQPSHMVDGAGSNYCCQ